MINVLIIEDNPAMQSAIKLLIQHRFPEAKFVVCSSGTEGLKAFKQMDFNFATLDIKLPDGNGLDFLSKLQISNPNTAIIVLSLYIDTVSSSDSLTKGAYAIIDKTEMKENLIPVIEQIVLR